MARKALIVKSKKTPKYSTRKYSRCLECGRSRFVLSIDGGKICRIHIRK
jgi:small subunit ribosomal protein S14